jgi:hypothetical protein
MDRRMNYNRRNLFLLVSVLASFLAACSRPPATTTSPGAITPTLSGTISLTARPAEVPSGASTVLAIRLESGSASTVDVAVKGNRPFVTNIALSEGGSYTFTSPVITQDTTFVVTAKDTEGATVAVAETVVLVSILTASVPEVAPEQIPATPETTTPETTTPETTTPETTPTSEAVTTEPAQTEPTGTSQEGLPEGAVRVGTLAELQEATSAEATATTIIIAGTIMCDADPCVRLKSAQTLMGEAGAVLLADRTNDGDLTTVIELAPDVSVVGLEISGPDIYTAINGVDSELSGTVLIRDVTITSLTNNAPVTVRDSDGAGAYTLLIDRLSIAETTRSVSFADFEKLELTNSTINLNVSEGSRGLIFQTSGSSTVLLDNVAVSSVLASDTFTPVNFSNVGSEGTLGVTVSNTAITFPTATPEVLATARSLEFSSNTEDGKIAIQTPVSVGNSTQATNPLTVVYDVAEGADPATVIVGYVQGTLGDGAAFGER